jgi:signal transduction histidine kinase
VLEQERLRIAQDIHDDLGARVTEISLFSGMAQADTALPDKARADFDRISRMSRELIAALYETVWAVNPENDNLDALGNFICQMVTRQCEPAQLRCRFDVLDLPQNVQVSSQTRHNIALAVKEAVHNAIKHAQASEVSVRAGFTEQLLTLSIEDSGCGFRPNDTAAGHGLTNMKRRLESIGGNCAIESEPRKGTRVRLSLALPAAKGAALAREPDTKMKL